MARSLNKVQLIGNLTRDPELRYTPNGSAVCSFGMATNRSWTTDSGEKKEEVDFHNIVAWRKLAELCSQFLVKGRKVYVEGRLSTRTWTGQDGQQRSKTEVVIDDMILLDSKGAPASAGTYQSSANQRDHPPVNQSDEDKSAATNVRGAGKKKTTTKEKNEEGSTQEEYQNAQEEVAPDDIPF